MLHSYALLFLLFLNVFTGFLFTTFPRFNMTQPIEKPYYVRVFYFNAFASLLFYALVLFAPSLLFLALIVAFIAHSLIWYKLYTIYKNSLVDEKRDSLFILIGISFGLLSHLLFIFFALGVDVGKIAVEVGVYLYAILTAGAVAFRMVPFFSHSLSPKNETFIVKVALLLGVLVLAHLLEFQILSVVVSSLLGVVIFFEIQRWQLHPFHAPAILWVLHLALYWLAFGFLLGGASELYELITATSLYFLHYHLILLGFLTTVLIGFGTRVILGHSGSVPHADRLSIALFITTQLVVIGRVLVSFDVAFGWGIGAIFDVTVALWIILFGVWGGRFFRVLVFGSRA